MSCCFCLLYVSLFLFHPISSFLSFSDSAGGKGIGEQEEIYFPKHVCLGAPKSILNLLSVTSGNTFQDKIYTRLTSDRRKFFI
jgi:hypothetical protein